MSLDTGPTADHYSEWQRYMQLFRTGESWRKILHGDVGVTGVLRTLAAKFGFAGKRKRRNKDLAEDLRRIVASGRRVTFVFSRLDAGYDLLMLGAGSAVKELRNQRRIDLWRIDGANHTFDARASREALLARLTEHLTSRY
jgi:hypothetical protein